MSKIGKGSAKKSKPSYFMAILGVTIVLFIWGILAVIFIYANQYRLKKSEDLEMNVYFKQTAKQNEIDKMLAYIKEQQYTKSAEFISKEEARKKMINDTTIDFSLLGENPLPDAIAFRLKNEYIHPDTLKGIKQTLETNTMIVNKVDFSENIVDIIARYFKRIIYILLGLAILLSVLVAVLIDNTIKLSMYSNRFLIKTMQMVGATRWFIAKPIDIRAILNGALSGAIAVAALWGIVFSAEQMVPEIVDLRDSKTMLWLSLMIIVLSITITLLSTHRSVIKYLKMKLDDLY